MLGRKEAYGIVIQRLFILYNGLSPTGSTTKAISICTSLFQSQNNLIFDGTCFEFPLRLQQNLSTLKTLQSS